MEHITINSDRSVTVPVELRKIGVQYDHNVNTIEFVGPRYSGNVDLSTMTIYINYILSDKTPGKYKAENVIIDDQDDSLIRFNWTITRNVTKASGILSCLVCAKKTDKEGNEINHWNTDIFRLLSVSEGMENDPVIQEQYPDVITSLIQNVEEHDTKLLEFSGLNNRVTDLENNIGELKGEIDNIHIPEQIQSDWTQNDDTQPDYVKNRPFYKEILESVSLYEMAVELSLHGDDIVPFYDTNEIHDKITSADKYLVRFDGVDYTCTAVKLDNGYGLGNLSLLNGTNYRPDCVYSSELEDTGEPFCIIDDQYYTPSTWFYARTDGDHSYAVHKIEEIIHPISGEFIPDLDKLSEKIDNIHIPEQIQSDWTQNDETAPDYIKNKPFYDNSWVLDTSNVLKTNDINSDVGFVLISNNPDDFYLSDNINYYGKYKNTEYKLTTPYYPTYDCNAFRYTDDNGNETTICYVVRQENTKIYIRNAGKHYEISNPSIGIWVKRDPQFGNKASIYTKDVHKIDEKYLPDLAKHPDWNQDDETAVDFVKNRPILPISEIANYGVGFKISTALKAVIINLTKDSNADGLTFINNTQYLKIYLGFNKKQIGIFQWYYDGEISFTNNTSNKVISGQCNKDRFNITYDADGNIVNSNVYFKCFENQVLLASVDQQEDEYKTPSQDTDPATKKYVDDSVADCIKSPASAEVGQIVKIAAVDDAGKPTAWEAVDLPEQIQSDWNQNDDTAADFVKNRPFYSEIGNMTVENAVWETLKGFPVFAVGDTVTVNVDGVEHSLVAYNDEGVAAIGDTFNSVNNGEGQLGWNIYVDEEVYFYATESHTVSYLGTVYHTIDKKYLPIGIQLNAVDGEIYLDQDNKTYTLSDGLVFDSLIGKRVLMLGHIYYIDSTYDNTVPIYINEYSYEVDSGKIVLSVILYLLSSDGTYTNIIKRITLA